MTRPNVLLESWLPFDAIGAERVRDASTELDALRAKGAVDFACGRMRGIITLHQSPTR